MIILEDENQQLINQLRQKAERYCLDKKWDDAIKVYEELFTFDSNFTADWYNLGSMYFSINKCDDAIEALRRAIELSPDRADIWYLLNNVYQDLDDFNEAIKILQEVIKLKPDHWARWEIGKLYLKISEPKHAITALKSSLAFDNTCENSWALLSEAYNANGDYDDAIHASNKVLKEFKKRKNKKALINLGIAHYSKGSYDEALKALKKIQKNVKERYLASFYMAKIFQTQNNIDDAIKMVNESLKINDKFNDAIELKKNLVK